VRNLVVSNRLRGSVLVGEVSSVAAPFSVISGGGAFALGSGQALTVKIEFAPTAPGPISSTLSIASNDPIHPSVAVALNGRGVASRHAIAHRQSREQPL